MRTSLTNNSRKSHLKIRRLKLLNIFASLLFISYTNTTELTSASICFLPTQTPSPDLSVFRNGPPPSDGNYSYIYYPITDAATLQISTLSKISSTTKYAWLWANRKAGKGNPVFYPRYEAKAFFTTYRRANTCTMLQARKLLGKKKQMLDKIAKKTGLTLVNRDDDISSFVYDGKLTDICVISNFTLPYEAKGILLDYEVWDDRSPIRTARFLERFTNLVHNNDKEVILYTNAFDGYGRIHNGFDNNNSYQLLQNFDKVGILLWSNNSSGSIRDSLLNQLDFIIGAFNSAYIPKKLLIVFELGNTTMHDARVVHKIMKKENYKNIMFWRNYSALGGNCGRKVNRQIACLALDQCD